MIPWSSAALTKITRSSRAEKSTACLRSLCLSSEGTAQTVYTRMLPAAVCWYHTDELLGAKCQLTPEIKCSLISSSAAWWIALLPKCFRVTTTTKNSAGRKNESIFSSSWDPIWRPIHFKGAAHSAHTRKKSLGSRLLLRYAAS